MLVGRLEPTLREVETLWLVVPAKELQGAVLKDLAWFFHRDLTMKVAGEWGSSCSKEVPGLEQKMSTLFSNVP